MSIQVDCFDENKAQQELKNCPKIVRDYVKLLKESNERWQKLANDAIKKLREKQEFKTTFKFYAEEGQPYIGAYRAGSLNQGEPQIMFAMDFHTWSIKDIPKEQRTDAFKEGILQTISHEFIHALQEMLDKDYDELEVQRVLGAYEPSWNVFEAPIDEEIPEVVFKISDFLDWSNKSEAKTVEEFKQGINSLFMAHRLWIEAEAKHKDNPTNPSP